MLEETGSEDAITLRGVARRAGVAAPSIYAHFADRDEIINAVVALAFAELDARLAAAVEGERSPRRRLRRLCEAYLAFAHETPHRYRLAVGRHRTTGPGSLPPGGPLGDLSGGQAFTRLVTAVADVAAGSGRSGVAAASDLPSPSPPSGTAHSPEASEATRAPGSSDPVPSTLLDATVLWVGLHGYATLADAVPAFPWPDLDTMLTELLNRTVPGHRH